MCSTTRIIWCFTFLNFLVFVQCAPELQAEDSYGIISTELAIRNTANNLFSTLKLKVMRNRLKLKQYSTIHNFFVSITLRDLNNLKKIAKLTEVDNIDNGTRVFITQLNEVLNEDNKSDEETDSVYVTFLINDFINRLDHLKDRHDIKNNTKNFDLNKAIIRYFNKKELGNTTYSKEEFAKENYSNDSVLSDNEIWQPSGRRVFEGARANIKLFPFMASVQFFRKFQCGGSIIKDDLIITSASCLQIAWNNRFFRENPLFLSVQVGSTFYDHGGENIPIMEIYFHPGFTPKTLRHNLAIMRLKSLLKFRKKKGKVKKIEIDRHPWPLPSNTEGIVIVGWGVKTFAGTVVTARKNKLSVATLEFYPLDECQEIYSKEFVTDRNFCAGFYSKGGGACNHDAGGPGVSLGILMGVISFGAPVCGTGDAPTVFTKLGYYSDWIEEIMEMEVLTARQITTLRPINLPTFRLPPITKKTPIKIMPIVDGKPYTEPSEPNVGRMDEDKHDFREFLKTFFKKKKIQKTKGRIKQEKTLEEETEEATNSSYESEVTDPPHETQEVTDSPNKTEKVKEIHKFKVKPILRNKPETATEKEIKPSSTKPKKKLKRKQKIELSTESQSQAKDDSEDKTTSIRPSTIFGSGKNTLLHSEDGGSSADASNSDEKVTSAFTPRVYLKKEESTNQDTEFDEAIDSLIDKLNIDFESNESSNKKVHVSHPDLTDKNKHKRQKRKKSRSEDKLKKNRHETDSNKRSDREHDNEKDVSSEDEGGEETGSNEYKNDEQSDNNHKPVTKAYVESHSTDTQENEDSEEVVHTVHKNNKNKRNKTGDKDKKSDEDKTNEEYKSLSIPTESSEQDNSSSNYTDRLIDMLDYEDIYKLLSGHRTDR